MGWQGRWFLGVFIQIWHGVSVNFTVGASSSSPWMTPLGTCLVILYTITITMMCRNCFWLSCIMIIISSLVVVAVVVVDFSIVPILLLFLQCLNDRCLPRTLVGIMSFRLELRISRVWLEISNINKVINPSFNVGHGGLIRRESPLVIDNELEGMLPALKVVNVGKIIPGSMHGYLTRPAVKCAGNVDVSTTMFPSKDGGDRVFLGGREGSKIERGRSGGTTSSSSSSGRQHYHGRRRRSSRRRCCCAIGG